MNIEMLIIDDTTGKKKWIVHQIIKIARYHLKWGPPVSHLFPFVWSAPLGLRGFEQRRPALPPAAGSFPCFPSGILHPRRAAPSSPPPLAPCRSSPLLTPSSPVRLDLAAARDDLLLEAGERSAFLFQRGLERSVDRQIGLWEFFFGGRGWFLGTAIKKISFGGNGAMLELQFSSSLAIVMVFSPVGDAFSYMFTVSVCSALYHKGGINVNNSDNIWIGGQCRGINQTKQERE